MRFRILNTATQGVQAVPQILDALETLDRDPAVDVIVLARGGGSVEDLLPFSDEALCRARGECAGPPSSRRSGTSRTPRSSTTSPTCARRPRPTPAKCVVPDLAEETAHLEHLRDPGAARAARLGRARGGGAGAGCGPGRCSPTRCGRWRRASDEVVGLVGRGTAGVDGGLRERDADVRHLRASLTALGPAATLARGYAIVQAGSEVSAPVLRSVDDAAPGDVLRVRLADGAVHARVEAPE